MTRSLKRRIYWSAAVIIAAAYVLSLTIYWAGGWHSYPSGVTGLVVLAVLVLFVGGLHAGQVMVVVRDEPAFEAKETAFLRSTAVQQPPVPTENLPGAEMPMFTNVVSMPNPKIYQLGILEGKRRAQKESPETSPE